MLEKPMSRWIRQLRLALEAPDADDKMCSFFSGMEADIYNRALDDVESLLGNDAVEADIRMTLESLKLKPHDSDIVADADNIVLFERSR